MATGTISDGPAFTAASTTAAALVLAGRRHRSARSGIAGDRPVVKSAAIPPMPPGGGMDF